MELTQNGNEFSIKNTTEGNVLAGLALSVKNMRKKDRIILKLWDKDYFNVDVVYAKLVGMVSSDESDISGLKIIIPLEREQSAEFSYIFEEVGEHKSEIVGSELKHVEVQELIDYYLEVFEYSQEKLVELIEQMKNDELPGELILYEKINGSFVQINPMEIKNDKPTTAMDFDEIVTMRYT